MPDATAIAAPSRRPAWLPNTQGFLAIAIVVLMFVILITLLMADIKLDERVYGALLTLLGVVAGCFKDVYSWAFGSSQKEEKKDDTLAAIAAAPTPPPAPASPPTTDQLAVAQLAPDEMAYFQALPDEEAKKRFISMSGSERAATIAKG